MILFKEYVPRSLIQIQIHMYCMYQPKEVPYKYYVLDPGERSEPSAFLERLSWKRFFEKTGATPSLHNLVYK